MNGRILFSDIVTRLVGQSPPSGTKIGTGYDAAYLSTFAKTYPAVWIVGQRMAPLDDGSAYSGQFRQHCRVDVLFRIVVSRIKAGIANNEADFDSMFTWLAGALKDWTPPGCDTPFVWSSAQDGAANEAVLYADQQFSAHVTYARP